MNNVRHYVGIGSREIPIDIAKLIEIIAIKLAQRGYILRSGGSPGADDAFEKVGIDGHGEMEIYLPFKNFRNKKGAAYIPAPELGNYLLAAEFAKKYCDNYTQLDREAKKLIIRDTYQVLGLDLQTRSHFVICWTLDACLTHSQRSERTGGTGQAISIASHYGIPVFNLKNDLHKEMIKNWLEIKE
ncbi:MAG: hypothetical protein FH762_01525 [Firmicutes bacterium]|nr:hypothetical protein [Bacillota bacterium]